MKKTMALLGALFCFSAVPALSQREEPAEKVPLAKPQDAKTLMDAAMKKAKAQKKAVLVVFDASW
jgi:hypothetical protein